MIRKLAFLVFAAITATFASADTFTNKLNGETFNGFATTKTFRNQNYVRVEGKGLEKLDLSDFDIEYNSLGRKNTFTTIKITEGLKCSAEAEAISESIKEAADKGYLFVLLELNARGGQRHTVRNMCSGITKTPYIPVYSYIYGAKDEGLHDYSVVMALACNKIFISPTASFGSEIINKDEEENKEKENTKIADMREKYGKNVGEKFTSIERGFVATLSQKNGRPKLLAEAMIDKNVEVIEVKNGSKIEFVEPSNGKKSDLENAKSWSVKGELLNLSADKAVKTGMADKIIATREEVIKELGAETAEENVFARHVEAREDFDKILAKAKATNKKIGEYWKKFENASSPRKKAASANVLMRSYQSMVKMGQQYPDLGINVTNMKMQVANLKGIIQGIRSQR